MQVIWSPSALRDVVQIRRYIANFNPRAAESLMEALIAAGDDLTAFPCRGRPVRGNLRELTLVYPYIIRYRIDANQVLILGVRHGMRRS